MSRKYEIDFTCLDDMSSDEIRSLLKSNRISWSTRKLIQVSLASKVVEEFIPVISIVIIGRAILSLLDDTTIENATTKKENVKKKQSS